ncbi:MAG: hypothetical protein OXC57_10430 [Rhodobacteraceae bacterium]|nr:hypothetical protein [Paracoccaceae bacterium]
MMISQNTKDDSHKIQWMEIEWELAARGILLPNQMISHEIFMPQDDNYDSQNGKDCDVKKSFPVKGY